MEMEVTLFHHLEGIPLVPISLYFVYACWFMSKARCTQTFETCTLFSKEEQQCLSYDGGCYKWNIQLQIALNN